MMQKQKITLDCLLLPDTQMADLEKEQRFFRICCLPFGHQDALPFNILPPFCPSSLEALESLARIQGKLIIGAAQNCGGWIVRPVPAMTRPIFLPETSFPGYPPKPSCPGFILGYAGSLADELIEGNRDRAQFKKDITVSVWARATLTVTVEFEEKTHYGAFYETGKAVWHRMHE